MKHTVKYYKLPTMLFVYILISVAAFSQPDIPVDDSLKNNSDSWKIKVKQKFFSNKPAIINFGAIKTIETNAEKEKQVSRDVNRELFWKNITTVTSRESNMLVTYNDIDTMIINILATTTEEEHKRNVTGTLFNADKNEETSYSAAPLIDEMFIHFRHDSLRWHFTKTDSITFISTGYIGKLQSPTDSFFIKPVNNYSGKKMKEIMFSQPASGFVFFRNGKQIAAFQLMINKKVWITKEMDQSDAKVILAAITGLFATIKPEYMQGN